MKLQLEYPHFGIKFHYAILAIMEFVNSITFLSNCAMIIDPRMFSYAADDPASYPVLSFSMC